MMRETFLTVALEQKIITFFFSFLIPVVALWPVLLHTLCTRGEIPAPLAGRRVI